MPICQECYGIAKVPPADSQWFCTACEVRATGCTARLLQPLLQPLSTAQSGKNPARLKCDLCPVTGPGHAFKPVLNGTSPRHLSTCWRPLIACLSFSIHYRWLGPRCMCYLDPRDGVQEPRHHGAYCYQEHRQAPLEAQVWRLRHTRQRGGRSGECHTRVCQCV